MIDTLISAQLLLGRVNVLDKLSLIDQALILADVEKNSGTAAMLREHQRAACRTNVLDERGRVRPKR
jgi:hypothetical protein